jgi:hypothetical protein
MIHIPRKLYGGWMYCIIMAIGLAQMENLRGDEEIQCGQKRGTLGWMPEKKQLTKYDGRRYCLGFSNRGWTFDLG